MNWNKPNPVLLLLGLLVQGCGIYSFLGTSLPPNAKTFSLQIQSNIALGPPDLAENFQQRLSDELIQRTSLKQVYTQGDLQLEGVIQKFEYVAMAPTTSKDAEERDQVSIDRLTIEIQMNYINPYNPDTSFKKKNLSQYADMSANASRSDEESRLIDDIFTKLIKDVFNETVANW